MKFLPSNSSSPLPAPTQLRERENSDNNTSANTFANNTPPIYISLAMENCAKVGKMKTNYVESDCCENPMLKISECV